MKSVLWPAATLDYMGSRWCTVVAAVAYGAAVIHWLYEFNEISGY